MNFWESLYVANPEALWLLILVPSSVLFLWKKLKGPRKPVLLGLGMMRGLLLVLLVLAISDPSMISRKITGGPHYFVGYDGSSSVDPDAVKSWLQNWRNQLNNSEVQLPRKITYFKLGKSLNTYKNIDELFDSLKDKPVSFSRIYEGVAELESLLDDLDYPIVILLSDGNETEHPNSFNSLVNRSLYWGALPVRKSRIVRMKSFDGPSKVLKNRNFKLRCLIHSSETSDITLELRRDGILSETRNLRVDKGYSFVEFDQKSDQLGSGVFQLKLKSKIEKDTFDSIFEHRVQFYQPKTTLIIGDQKNLSLQNLLKDVGFNYELRVPENLSKNEDFNSYSFVLIDNVKSKRLSSRTQSNLKRFVFEGGGLAMLGGMNSFGQGGYYDSPIEEALPVYMPPRSYRKSFAVVFIIDSSGSMLADSKSVWNNPHELQKYLQTADSSQIPIWVAKNAAKQIIKEMRGIDVGVVNFNTSASLAVPIQKVTDENMQWFTQGIDSIRAGGGTKFYPALNGASSLLLNRNYTRVDFIFLSDGSPSDWNDVPEALRQLKEDNIRVTSIAFGEEANRPNLMDIAKITGGKFYSSANVNSLSEIFKKAVDDVFGPPLVQQRIGTRWVPNQRFIRPEPINLPDLLGYTATSPKDRGQIVIASEVGDPIFAIWNFGLGHSLAWTPDLSGFWSAEWITHPVLRKLMSSAFQKLSKKRWDPYDVKLDVNGNKITVSLTAFNDQGEPISNLDIKAKYLNLFDNTIKESLAFRYMGEGHYVAQALISISGDYNFLYEIKHKKKALSSNREIRFKINDSLELGFKSSNKDFANILKRMDEGRLLSKNANLFSIFEKYKDREQIKITSFSLFFLGIAIFLLCVEVLFRRFRILEELQQETQDEKEKFERIATHSLKLAREALNKGNNSQAERFYLSAHRYLKQAGYEVRSRAVWDEYRAKVK